jgi:phenylalanyl-tRNA synthetase alpha chain
MARAFPPSQYRILTHLKDRDVPLSLRHLAADLALPYPRVAGDCQALAAEGLLEQHEATQAEYSLGRKAAERRADILLPEWSILKALYEAGRSLTRGELARQPAVNPPAIGIGCQGLLVRGWATEENNSLSLTPLGRRAAEREEWGEEPDDKLFRFLKSEGKATRGEIEAKDIDLNTAMSRFERRGGSWIVTKQKTLREVSLTERGRELLQAGITERKQVNLLTEELLKDGAWRDVEFRPYDVTLESAVVCPGKSHPLRRVMESTRTALLEMGFTELRSPLVESAFWDFDALFQPQDHPAREMQDTYYVARPAKASLPDDAVVAKVGETHESGGDTGSTGWGYTWKRERAARTTLRTHTTATTVRAVAAHPEPPGRYFTVGLVFRREAADTRHLCAFYQVDGIIIDERGSLASLLGTLRALYTRIGLKNVHFAPDFFPYTEPSVEVRTWLPGDEQWLELCGAGIFRPEVTQPLGCRVPVLAWGGGLERIAMALYGLDDMRALYQMDMDVLRRTALCPR